MLRGLGFASAIVAMMTQATPRLATLAGFTSGVEFGQFAFVGAVLARPVGVRREKVILANWSLPRIASLAAGVLRTAMLIARVVWRGGVTEAVC